MWVSEYTENRKMHKKTTVQKHRGFRGYVYSTACPAENAAFAS
jgi:hypothetical protein